MPPPGPVPGPGWPGPGSTRRAGPGLKTLILGEMLQTIDKNTGGISNINTIMTNLERQLKDKKFLLVLDDVWNEEYGKWESLRDRLLKVVGINHGNAVVVTTRLPLVASIMENPPVFRHELKQLSNDECWSIIRKIVSRNGGESIPSELESIGIDIAKKCGGVPLAASIIGGMLLSEKKEKWLSIKKNEAVEKFNLTKKTFTSVEIKFRSLVF